MTLPMLELLGGAGPAQAEQLIHFTGRSLGRQPTPTVPPEIRDMSASHRLHEILWTQRLRGFTPFGGTAPMICFSESPLEHLNWLIGDRGWEP